MKQFRIIMAIVVLTASIFLLFSRLFTPQPIQIILETGQEVTTQSSDYFSLADVLLLITDSFLIGLTATYLYYNSDTGEVIKSLRQNKKPGKDKDYEMVLPLLKGDERKVFSELMASGGEMLQNALVLRTGLTKVKMTRILSSLENKQLIAKERHGLTNRIKLKK